MQYTVVPKPQPDNEIWFKANQPMNESYISAAYTNANAIGLKYEDDWYKIVYDDVVTSVNWAMNENEPLRYIEITEIQLPNSVMSIEDYAFNSCWELTSITIPNSVTSIGKASFGNCHELTHVTIGSGVTSIEGYAFSPCGSLTSITFEGTIDQWNSISKPDNWESSPATYVQCSDGQVTL